MRAVSGIIVLILLSLLPSWGDARTITVRDLVRTVRLSDPHFSPDCPS
jgi:hypothetical protein